MSGNLIFAVVFLVISIVNYSNWKKKNDKDYLWAALVWLMPFFANLFDFMVTSVFSASPQVRMIAYQSVRIILPVAVVLSIIIYVKGKSKNK